MVHEPRPAPAVSLRPAAPPLSSRTLLLTGKGGVGKTTVAAATAVHLARRGVKTLVLSTDRAHSLGDALARPLGPVPQEVEPGLFGLQVDPRARLETHWRYVQEHLVTALDELGVDPVAAEELTVLPAAEEVLALLELRDQARSGTFDAVVVDCAPTAETLRLLALPEALSLYLARAVPVGRRVARAVRTGLTGTGRDPVLEALHRLAGELADVRAVLTDKGTSVRLVLTPDAVVLAEARRSYTALSLHGYVVDAAVVNRLVPPGEDPWRTARAAHEARVLDDAADAFGGVPLLRAPHTLDEPVGPDALAQVAEAVYADDDPMGPSTARPGLQVERDGEELVLVLQLPLVRREGVDLARRGEDLVVEVDGTRRVLHLPSALRRCRVRGASLRDGLLRVRFAPDPELWRPL